MSNVISFPNGKERIAFKRNIAKTKRNNIFNSILQLVSKAVFVGFWILSCSAQHLVSLIQEHMPFHRICRV